MLNARKIIFISVSVVSALLLAILFISEEKMPSSQVGSEAPPKTETQSKATANQERMPLQTKLLLKDSVTPHFFELPTEAATIWRRYKSIQPALLLLSNDPFLTQVPKAMESKVSTLLNSSNQEEIRRRSNPQMASPVLFPEMVIDAILPEKMFSHYLWAIPLTEEEDPVSAKTLRERMLNHRLASKEEVDTFVDDPNGTIRGTVRDVPFTAGVLELLPSPDTPLILHIDLSYYQAQYTNEINTPVFQLIQDTMKQLQQMECNVLDVTFSYGNLDGRIAQDVRFMGDIHKDIMAKPTMIFDDLPNNYKRQADALYLEALFRKGQAHELYLAQEQELPETAWVKYNLFRSNANHKRGDLALSYLAKAIEFDNVYAMAYFDLSDQALRIKLPAEAFRMLKLASGSFPDNPTIKLKMAELAYSLMDFKTAEHLIAQLQQLPWSEVYHQEMPAKLERFMEMTKEAIELKSTDKE